MHWRERLMTETQGWIAIVLLLLILAQLVMVGGEMRGLRKNFTSRIDALYQKFFGAD
jgi:branched-subunit amino acid permease